MKKEPKTDVVWPIRMSQELKDKFKNHCDKHGFSMNKKIKLMIEQEIKNG
jgi:antitoxin component of RelBE/YafQ-DinJ toxin-antitoxin module